MRILEARLEGWPALARPFAEKLIPHFVEAFFAEPHQGDYCAFYAALAVDEDLEGEFARELRRRYPAA